LEEELEALEEELKLLEKEEIQVKFMDMSESQL
jgi:hypothetical protein